MNPLTLWIWQVCSRGAWTWSYVLRREGRVIKTDMGLSGERSQERNWMAAYKAACSWLDRNMPDARLVVSCGAQGAPAERSKTFRRAA